MGLGRRHGVGLATYVTGSGNVSVNASQSLSARVTGSGNIRYKGNPRVDKQVTGSGHVGAD